MCNLSLTVPMLKKSFEIHNYLDLDHSQAGFVFRLDGFGNGGNGMWRSSVELYLGLTQLRPHFLITTVHTVRDRISRGSACQTEHVRACVCVFIKIRISKNE